MCDRAPNQHQVPVILAYENPIVRESKLLVRETTGGLLIELPFRNRPLGTFVEVMAASVIWISIMAFVGSLFIAIFMVIAEGTPFPALYVTLVCTVAIWGYARLRGLRYFVRANLTGLEIRHESLAKPGRIRDVPCAAIVGFAVRRGSIPTFHCPFDVVAKLRDGSAVCVIPVANEVEGGWVVSLLLRATAIQPVVTDCDAPASPEGR